MSITENFTRQHHEIIYLSKQLEDCAVEEYICKDASFVYSLQESLDKVVCLHLRLEDTALYPLLHEHNSLEVRSASLRLKEEFNSYEESYMAYKESYPSIESIENNAAAYVKDTHALIKMIRTRINKEERELYSLLR